MSWRLYRATIPPVRPLYKNLLASLRTLAIVGITTALCQPVIHLVHERTRPARAHILLDQSHSMSVTDALGARDEIVRSFVDGQGVLDLADRADVSWFGFGISSGPIDPDTAEFDDVGTAIGAAIVNQRRRTVPPERLIVVSDGANTSGPDPIEAAAALGAPVDVVAVGDDKEPPDLRIGTVRSPEIAVAGEPFDLEVTISNGSVDRRRGRLSVMREGSAISDRKISLPRSGQKKIERVSITLPKPGTARLEVLLDPAPQEVTTQNNRWSTNIEVMSGRTKVAVIADAPSADVGWLMRRLTKRDRTSVRLWLVPQKGRFDPVNPFSTDSLDAQDIVVLMGVGADVLTSNVSDNLLRYLKNGGAVLMVTGIRTPPKSGPFADVLPLHVRPAKYRVGEVAPMLSTAGLIHPIFADDLSLGVWASLWTDLPPLLSSMTGMVAKPKGVVLLEHRGEPLAAAGRIGRGKIVLAGISTFWRWDMLSKGNNEVVEVAWGFWGNLIRWLAVPTNLKRVRIRPDKRDIRLGETVGFDIQVYDEAFSPLDGADVTVNIGGQEITARAGGRGHYRVSVSAYESGNRKAVATAQFGDKQIGEGVSVYSVSPYGVEQSETRQRRELLEAIAERSGGSYATIANSDSLLASIDLSPILEKIRREIDPGRSGWLLAGILCLLASEWALRKYFGMS